MNTYDILKYVYISLIFMAGISKNGKSGITYEEGLTLQRRIHRLFWLILFFLLLGIVKSPLPVQQTIHVGEPLIPQLTFPPQFTRSITVRVYDQQTSNPLQFLLSDKVPVALAPGQLYMQLRLFNLLPFHQMIVNVMEPTRVVVGGHSIGVLIHPTGVLVVSGTGVRDCEGKRHYPAMNAGILPGDVIVKINNKLLKNERQLRDEINQSGEMQRPVVLEVRRKKRVFTVTVNPVFCVDTLRYRIGLFIRDSAAGMGTLTFYEPQRGYYGALGHMVVDVNGFQRMDLTDGQIRSATVQDIRHAQRGKPGEKIGLFQSKGELVGSIKKNTVFGIFGILQRPLTNPCYSEPLPVALTHEIKVGSAEILTVLQGEQIERFTIEIEKVIPQVRTDGKGLVIRVTDEDLLKRAGGIIQGMSGSPIIQDGKLVGAVTHVFINDPSRGYGVPAEWMLREVNMSTLAGGYFFM